MSLCNMLLESDIPIPLSWDMNHAGAGIEVMIGLHAPAFGLTTFSVVLSMTTLRNYNGAISQDRVPVKGIK